MISDEKQRLRAEARRRIRAMTSEERRDRSARISEWLARELGPSPGVVLGFAAMPLEPDWHSSQMETWTIGLPRVIEKGLEFHRVLRWDALVAGALGNREPVVEAGSTLGEGAVALVPGLAFDAKGGRLGRGGGFYDRFLAGFRGRKIGVCFACQIVDEVPREPHDAAVDEVLTENGWAFTQRSGEH